MSAIFSASEAALLSASPAKIHKLAEEGDKGALLVQSLIERKESLLGTILFANNLVNVCASAIATELCLDMFGDNNGALIIATALMTVLIVIYAEFLPKTFAVRQSESISLKVSYIIYYLDKLLTPFVYIAKLVVNSTLKVISPRKISNVDVSAFDTIKSSIALHYKEGEMRSEDKFMLNALIDLAEINVEEIMIHRNAIYGININDDIKKIVDKLVASPYSRIPVYEDSIDNIIGILNLRDFLKLKLAGKKMLTIVEIKKILREPWYIPNTTSLKQQLLFFRQKHQPFALVVNEYGELQGLVTLEDIMEEVVGQIDDEYDIATIGSIKRVSDESIVISGDVTIRDVNREMNWEISDEEANTIGGLMFHLAKQVPSIGDVYVEKEYSFKLLKKKKNKLQKIKVERKFNVE